MASYFEKYSHTIITLAAIAAAFVGLVTISGNRLDVQDRFISQLFQANNQRFDAQERLINQRLDAQDRLINQHFAAVNQRLDGQDKRLDGQDRRLDARDRLISQQFAAVNERLDRLTDGVAEIRRIIVGISERVSRNEGAIDVIRERLRIADTPSP